MEKALENAVSLVCWSCSAARDESALFCPQCGRIQPPRGENYYAVFGLAPRLELDPAMLEREFHQLSRRLHPDRFQRAGADERRWSLAGSALVNDAYRTLRDPIRRTEYLLRLEGAPIGEEHAGRDRTDPSRVPADLLEEVFELNLQLEEMAMAGKAGGDDPEARAGLTAAKARFDGLLEEVDRDLGAHWKAWDEGGPEVRAASVRAMAALLDRRRYLRNLVRDVTETLGA